jgi:hypothetical protein
MSVLSLYLIVLLLSGSVLLWEARTGRMTPGSPWSARLRAGLFFAAAVVGGALLLRTFGASPMLAAALVPVTALSLFRLVWITRLRRPGLLAGGVLAVALAVGLSASLSFVPKPLDQRDLFELIFHPDGSTDSRSIDPAARRSVRA